MAAVACAHCAGCCPHCASVCGGFHGASPFVLGNAFHIGGGGGTVPLFGGVGMAPYLGGLPFSFRRKHSSDVEDDNTDDEKYKAAVADPSVTKVNCDALVDHDHPEHRDAVQSISHQDEPVHKSLLERVKAELAKL